MVEDAIQYIDDYGRGIAMPELCCLVGTANAPGFNAIFEGDRMSLERFGMTTATQTKVLLLAGVVNDFYEDGTTDARRLEGMRTARRKLRDWTGADFGYDLEAWHEFLSNHPRSRDGYTHPYAWDLVEPGILRLIDDPDRIRLVKLLEAEDREG